MDISDEQNICIAIFFVTDSIKRLPSWLQIFVSNGFGIILETLYNSSSEISFKMQSFAQMFGISLAVSWIAENTPGNDDHLKLWIMF
mmetsp:Transcript_8894/g.17622  ORF Transcript_8894/g.17622 Transcript_8894/m.17622 type:complete len:87 (+) Transcript_8894:190-450(+)